MLTSEEGSTPEKSKITVSPAVSAGNSYKIKIAANPTIPSVGSTCSNGYTNWDGIEEIIAENGKTVVVVEVDSSNIAVAVGTVISNAAGN